MQLRNLGVPLSWSLMEDVRPADPRFAETPADVQYWEQVRGQGLGQEEHGWGRHASAVPQLQHSRFGRYPEPSTVIRERFTGGSGVATQFA